MDTWNVLTLAQDGNAELISSQVVKHWVDIAQLSGARIPGSGLTTVCSFTLCTLLVPPGVKL